MKLLASPAAQPDNKMRDDQCQETNQYINLLNKIEPTF